MKSVAWVNSFMQHKNPEWTETDIQFHISDAAQRHKEHFHHCHLEQRWFAVLLQTSGVPGWLRMTRMTRTATWLNNSFIQRALPDGCTGQVSPTDRQALPTRCGMPTSSHILANRAVSLLQVDNFVGWISLTRGQTSTRQHMKPLLYGCSGTNESKIKAHCSLKDVHCSLNLLI